MSTQTYSTEGTYYWTCPAGVTSVQVECWGPGGSGGNGAYGYGGGGGGGGGAYAIRYSLAVTPGNTYTIVVGAGGSTTLTTFNGTSCVADYGRPGASSGSPPAGGSGGLAANSTGDSTESGTNGAPGSNPYGGRGGGSPHGGGNTSTANGNGYPGNPPGGGASGGAIGCFGGTGADGQVTLTYTEPITLTPGAAVLTLTPYAPIIPIVLAPGAASLALTPQQPALGFELTLTPGAAVLTLTPQAPTIYLPLPIVLTPGAAQLTLTPYQPYGALRIAGPVYPEIRRLMTIM